MHNFFYKNVILYRDDVVLVDDTAWDSLQVFSSERHPAPSRRGFGHKEGLSIYSLLNRCSTAQGSKFLKMSLWRPTRNLNILKRRFDVIEYCFNPANMEFVKKVTECLKQIKSFPVSIIIITTITYYHN